MPYNLLFILRLSFAEPSVGRVGQVGRVRVRAARGKCEPHER